MLHTARRTAALLAASAALVLPTVATAATEHSASAQLPSTLAGIPAASSLHMQGGKVDSLATAQRLATTRSLIVLTPGQLNGYAAAMHSANRNLRILLYVNGMFAQQNQGSTFPSAWYMRAEDGSKIQSKGWGNYLMNPLNNANYTAGGVTYTSWGDFVSKTCKADLAKSGADGCMLDMLGAGPLDSSYNQGGETPVTASGSSFTTTQWFNNVTGPVAQLTEQVSGKPVIGNGIANGRRYYGGRYGPSKQLLSYATGGQAEIWMRDPSQSITAFPSDSAWRTEVQMLSESSASDRAVLATVKTWVSATGAQLEQWRRFTLASFLIGNQGHAYYEFSPATKLIWTDNSPLYSMAIGSPTETYASVASYLHGGVYIRHFSSGVAIVNTSTSAVKVSLGATYRTVTGSAVTSISVPAHDGAVLTR